MTAVIYLLRRRHRKGAREKCHAIEIDRKPRRRVRPERRLGPGRRRGLHFPLTPPRIRKVLLPALELDAVMKLIDAALAQP
jgi:hypothetical protein